MFLKLKLLTITLLFLCSCNTNKWHLEKFNKPYERGEFAEAEEFAKEKAKLEDAENADLLWCLQAAKSAHDLGKFEESNKLFDQAERILKYRQLSNQALDAGRQLAAVAYNDNALPYKESYYGGILINTYKALNFIFLKDWGNARVELNRAVERQRLAVEGFKKEVAERQQEVDDLEAEYRKEGLDMSQVFYNSGWQGKLRQQYPDLDRWEIYSDFTNPYTSFLHALFFYLRADSRSDYNLALESLKRLAGMFPQNRMVGELLEDASEAKRPKKSVWVVYENGLAPKKGEFRLDLPLALFTDKVFYTGIALPKLENRPYATGELRLNDQSTVKLTDMDKVIQTEFKKSYKWVVTRAVVSMVIKTLAQYSLERNDHRELAVLMTAFQALTTTADVRSWTSLPKSFHIARVDYPSDGVLRVKDGARNVMNVSLPKGEQVLVHLRQVSKRSKMECQVVKVK